VPATHRQRQRLLRPRRTFQEARAIAARLAAQRNADGGTRWPAVHAVRLLGDGLLGDGLLGDGLLGDGLLDVGLLGDSGE